MPAGDAGLERQASPDLAYLRQTVAIVGYLLPSHCEQLFAEVERLQTQFVAQQVVVDAARGVLNCVGHGGQEAVWHHQADGACLDLLDKALRQHNAGQAAQPEGER